MCPLGTLRKICLESRGESQPMSGIEIVRRPPTSLCTPGSPQWSSIHMFVMLLFILVCLFVYLVYVCCLLVCVYVVVFHTPLQKCGEENGSQIGCTLG